LEVVVLLEDIMLIKEMKDQIQV
jgi:hypothetical protein